MKLSRVLQFIHQGSLRVHFSQHGEDVMLHKLFGRKRSTGFYIDIGAHHPFRQSNTAYLWLMGWNGVNVDASQAAINLFRRVRPRDVNLWTAVVDEATAESQTHITLHSNMALDLGATCDPELARQRGTTRTEQVPCTSITAIINRYGAADGADLDLLNIDIEGFDERAIASIDQWQVRPRVLCIEMAQKDIRALLDSHTCHTLERAGYLLTDRMGQSAIFQRQDG
jgi:FkbM family methyltransferase